MDPDTSKNCDCTDAAEVPTSGAVDATDEADGPAMPPDTEDSVDRFA